MKTKMITIQVRMNVDDAADLRKVAKNENRSVSNLGETIFKEYIKNHSK